MFNLDDMRAKLFARIYEIVLAWDEAQQKEETEEVNIRPLHATTTKNQLDRTKTYGAQND